MRFTETLQFALEEAKSKLIRVHPDLFEQHINYYWSSCFIYGYPVRKSTISRWVSIYDSLYNQQKEPSQCVDEFASEVSTSGVPSYWMN